MNWYVKISARKWDLTWNTKIPHPPPLQPFCNCGRTTLNWPTIQDNGFDWPIHVELHNVILFFNVSVRRTGEWELLLFTTCYFGGLISEVKPKRLSPIIQYFSITLIEPIDFLHTLCFYNLFVRNEIWMRNAPFISRVFCKLGNSAYIV